MALNPGANVEVGAVHGEDEGAGPIEEAYGKVSGLHAIYCACLVVVLVSLYLVAPYPTLALIMPHMQKTTSTCAVASKKPKATVLPFLGFFALPNHLPSGAVPVATLRYVTLFVHKMTNQGCRKGCCMYLRYTSYMTGRVHR